jgi:hypothetical protein
MWEKQIDWGPVSWQSMLTAIGYTKLAYMKTTPFSYSTAHQSSQIYMEVRE